MIRLVEALGYRALRYARQSLLPFEVLVGPNGSGKTTFLDVIDLLADLIEDGPEAAVGARATDIRQLTFRGGGTRFEAAIEMAIPAALRERLPNGKPGVCRYEVALGEMDDGSLGLLSETLWLKADGPATDPVPALFPMPPSPPLTIVVAPAVLHRPDGKKSSTRSPSRAMTTSNPKPRSGTISFASDHGSRRSPTCRRTKRSSRLPPGSSVLSWRGLSESS